MIYIIQAFAAFLAALVISKTWADFRRGSENLPIFIFWASAWVMITIVAFFPQLIDRFTVLLGGQIIGIGRIFGMALVFLFFVIYRVYVKADRIERELVGLVRDLALGKGKGQSAKSRKKR